MLYIDIAIKIESSYHQRVATHLECWKRSRTMMMHPMRVIRERTLHLFRVLLYRQYIRRFVINTTSFNRYYENQRHLCNVYGVTRFLLRSIQSVNISMSVAIILQLIGILQLIINNLFYNATVVKCSLRSKINTWRVRKEKYKCISVAKDPWHLEITRAPNFLFLFFIAHVLGQFEFFVLLLYNVRCPYIIKIKAFYYL